MRASGGGLLTNALGLNAARSAAVRERSERIAPTGYRAGSTSLPQCLQTLAFARISSAQYGHSRCNFVAPGLFKDGLLYWRPSRTPKVASAAAKKTPLAPGAQTKFALRVDAHAIINTVTIQRPKTPTIQYVIRRFLRFLILLMGKAIETPRIMETTLKSTLPPWASAL